LRRIPAGNTAPQDRSYGLPAIQPSRGRSGGQGLIAGDSIGMSWARDIR
jgi:hypothetical protein